MAADNSSSGWNLSRAVEPDQVLDYVTGELVGGADHVTLWYESDATGRRHREVRRVSDDQVSAAAESLGRQGGESTSPAKQAAARANGDLGGRPPNNP